MATYPVRYRSTLEVNGVPVKNRGKLEVIVPDHDHSHTHTLEELGMYVDDEGFVRVEVPEPEPEPEPDPEPGDDPQWAVDLRAHWDAVEITATSVAPLSIPHDGSTSASAALQSWIASQPNGAGPQPDGTISYRRLDLTPLAGGTVRLGTNGIDLRNRSYLQLYMPGVKFDLAGSGADNTHNWVLTGGSTDIWIIGGEIDGLNPTTGTTAASFNEKLNAIGIRRGSRYINVEGVRWDRLKGFGPMTSGAGSGGAPTDIWVHDCYVRGGEMGLAWTDGVRVLFEDLVVVDSAINAMDVEPDQADDQITDLLIKNIDVQNFGWYQALTPWFWSSVPGGAGEAVTMRNITVEGCTVTNVAPGHGSHPGRMGLTIRADDPNPKFNYVIRNNSTTHVHQDNGPAMNFRGVDGLVVTGNRAPIGSGSFVDASGCTNTTLGPNDTTL